MMGINKLLVGFMVFVFALSSCGNKILKQQRIMDGIVYEVMPFKNDTSSDDETSSFKFVISEKKAGTKIQDYFKPSNYNKLLFYINKNLNADFKLKINEKDVYPIMVHFEPNMRMTNKLVFLIAFEKNNFNDNVSFEFNDNLFNNGNIKFKITNDFNI
ncbi:MAG: hypothetical protein Q7W45_10815 [Bacteroidota bacterium]|nr:hypothetical protein [Bacteroidota bacterium]MDP3146054.1 hypothetical protein [Bacteroidota bacterium]